MDIIFKFIKAWTCCGGIFLFFFFLGAVGFAGAEYNFLSHAKTAPATVIAVRQEVSHSSRGSGYTFRPEISYVVPETGKTQEVWVNFSSNPSFYKAGDAVEVFYNPATPETAQLKTFWMVAIPFIMLFVAVVVLCIFGFKAVRFSMNPEGFLESMAKRYLGNMDKTQLENMMKNAPRGPDGKIDLKSFQDYMKNFKQ